jgi:hypothetical protein
MGKSSRDKGGRGEREVAEILRSVFPEARRRFSSEESQGVVLGRDLNGVEPLVVQCELAARPRIEKKLREAVSAMTTVDRGGYRLTTGEIPVAFTRRSSRSDRANGWLVTMRADDFVRIVSVYVQTWRMARIRERQQGDPWCEPCKSYHPKPRDAEHKAALRCFA